MMNGNFINYIDIILTIDILYHRVLKNFQVFMKNLMFIYEKFNFYKWNAHKDVGFFIFKMHC